MHIGGLPEVSTRILASVGMVPPLNKKEGLRADSPNTYPKCCKRRRADKSDNAHAEDTIA